MLQPEKNGRDESQILFEKLKNVPRNLRQQFINKK